MTVKKAKRAKPATAKMNKDQWILFLLNDSASFAKTKAALKPIVEAGLARRRDLKPEEIKRLRRILEAIAAITARTYLERIWENRKESFDHYFGWFVKESIKGFDAASGQVDSDALRERLREAMGGGCGDSSCSSGHCH